VGEGTYFQVETRNIYKGDKMFIFMFNKRLSTLVVSVVCVFSTLSFVSADTLLDIALKAFTGITPSTSPVSSIAPTFFESPGFLKFLVFLLVTLIIYGILDAVLRFKGGKKKYPWFLRFSIAIILGFLSTFSLKDTEIATILIGHGALGITLSAVIPFILIAILTSEMTEAGYGFWSNVVWIIFGMMLFSKVLSVDVSQNMFAVFSYLGVGLCILIMILFGKKISKIMNRDKDDAEINRFKRRRRRQDARLEDESDLDGTEAGVI
jgi:hypothetical protein